MPTAIAAFDYPKPWERFRRAAFAPRFHDRQQRARDQITRWFLGHPIGCFLEEV
jgi:hypothetical protein